MASQYSRFLPLQTLSSTQTMPRDEVLDLGAYNTLQIQLRVLVAGSGGNVKIQHAAVNEPDAFKDLSGASAALNATGNHFVTVTNFLRYLRWVTDGSVSGSPAVLIDIIAKE